MEALTLTDISVTSEGEFVVCGSLHSFWGFSTPSSGFIAKFDSNGNELWALPLRDDLTSEVLASAFGRDHLLDEQALAGIQAFFGSVGRVMTPNNRSQ